jgi:hypothetical protein
VIEFSDALKERMHLVTMRLQIDSSINGLQFVNNYKYNTMKILELKKCSQVIGGDQCERLWRRYDRAAEWDDAYAEAGLPNTRANRLLDKIIRLDC